MALSLELWNRWAALASPVGLLILAGLAGATAAEPGSSPGPSAVIPGLPDPNVWLEEVSGERPLSWVRDQNAISTKELEASPLFEPTRKRLLAILDSKERSRTSRSMAPVITTSGATKPIRAAFGAGPLWTNSASHPHLGNGCRPGSLSRPKSKTGFGKDTTSCTRRMIDAWCFFERRRGCRSCGEFDLTTKTFITDGFNLPEAKTQVAWRNRDALYVGTDFGPGSLTDSGYPRISRNGARNTALKDAKTWFEGTPRTWL